MKPYYEWWDHLAPELDAEARRRLVRALDLAANRWIQDNPDQWLDQYLSLLLEGEPSAKVPHWTTPLPPTAS